MFQRAVPIFAVPDVGPAITFYARLGFDVRSYTSGDYGFATRGGVEIHLGRVADIDRDRASAYVHVIDADAVAAESRPPGGEVHGPQDTEWGQYEGALVDPDGNIIRFGSPMRVAGRSSPT
jgi:catechol 2,3-dioxygenase-like lactoylglutathione lyase family enzyme